MKFVPINLTVNYTKTPYAVVDSGEIAFGWSAEHDAPSRKQGAYRIKIAFMDETLWDSGKVSSSVTAAKHSVSNLPSGAQLIWSLQLWDDLGNLSETARGVFQTACLESWKGKWISDGAETEDRHSVLYFYKAFRLDRMPVRAVLYHCGLGLDSAYINGVATNAFRLQPAFTNYPKRSLYITDVIDVERLRVGHNALAFTVAGGWRKNTGYYLENLSSDRKIEFLGNLCLNAQLVLYFSDGTCETVYTDSSWHCATGGLRQSHLFDGEVFDENYEIPDWKERGFDQYFHAREIDFAPEALAAQTMEPIVEKREIQPLTKHMVDGVTVYDFGENLSGLVRLKIRGRVAAGTKFILRHAEELRPEGTLFTDTLRSAKAQDTYICKGGYYDTSYCPQFTYHGFRYASLEIQGDFAGSAEVAAVVFYNDLDTEAFFRSGNSLLNDFYRMTVRTEQCNMHSLATDCPQRDERMGWLNDATVRFPVMPYTFGVVRFFDKIVNDIIAEQDAQGRITCTAPFVYGERPADPVCSAFLLAVREMYRATGDQTLVQKYYPHLVQWTEYLQSRTEDHIVEYSYYGDWAGPADCCYSKNTIGDSDKEKMEEYDTGAAYSSFIPGQMISTGFLFWNYRLLAEFAQVLGKEAEVRHYEARADAVRKAYLDRWLTEGGYLCNTSQACQAFSLYIGIVPETHTRRVFETLLAAVEACGYRIQTGNIITPMVLEVLSRYGHADAAWKIMTREDYPSWGYMLANGATTVWERFELKEQCGMNSHNHPMYGASAGWIYASLLGYRVEKPLVEVSLQPNLPKALLYAEAKIPVGSGYLHVKCERKYGKKIVSLNVPFGLTARLRLDGEEVLCESGFSVHMRKE